ncbi:MAG: sodium:solute symporter [Sulfolobaceae archaeon]|nr:sodium:solute symporter [Sulfolobaceae archaeon]
MAQGIHIDITTVIVFIVVFIVFAFLGFYGSRWRRGDLSKLSEWALAGRKLGWFLNWFLMGADLFTAYTFIAVPSLLLASGPVGFFAVPYVAWGFAVELLIAPRLWTVARNRGYVTAADFVKDRFNSRLLPIAIALTGTVAELPYIALQIIGMEAVLIPIFLALGVSAIKTATDLALLVSFIILAAFVFTSGLRGATLTGVFKDLLIWITVLVVIIYVPLAVGGFGVALHNAQTLSTAVDSAINHVSKPILYAHAPTVEAFASAYLSLALGSALALFLYPHAVNGYLSPESKRAVKLSAALLPIYGIGLALIALFAILIYSVPNAVNLVVATKNGALTVPSLIGYTLPSWFVGLAYVGIFIGGLVPAAIMAIGVANLLTRNVIKEFWKDMPEHTEATLAKWISTAFKFVALAFVFIVPATYAIQLQLLGGILIAQTLPPVFLGLYTDKLEPRSLFVGWLAGIGSGVYLTLLANHFGPLKTSAYLTPIGPLYIAVIALSINLVISLVGTGIAYALGWRPAGKIKAEEITMLK